MKMSKEKRREKLISSFELLKQDYHENDLALQDLVGQMAKIDLDTAPEMWKDLIEENKGVLYSSYDFGFSFMYSLEKAIGEEKLYRIVADDEFLRTAIYKYSGDLRLSPLQAIGFFVKSNDLQTANTLLELAFSNRRKETSRFEILDEAIPDPDYCSDMPEETFEFLNEWIKKVPDKKERTKLEIKMMHFLEDDPDDEDY